MIIKTALVSTAIFCAMAVPGFCAPSFAFEGSGGTFSASGDVLSAAGVDFTSLVVTNDGSYNGTYAITNGSSGPGVMSLSGGYLTLYGDVTGLAGVSGALGTAATELFQIKVSNTTTVDTTNPATITFATGPGDITFGTTLLSDLGALGDLGTCGTGTCGISSTPGGGPNYTVGSTDLTMTASPEPVSFLLTGGGLLFLGGLARRKRKA